MKSMTYSLASTVVIIMLALAMIRCAGKPADADTTGWSKSTSKEELGQMNRDFAKALTSKDAVAAAMLYDENASILPPNEPMVTGRANIQAYWQGAIDAGIIDASVKTLDAGSEGDLGYEIGTFTMHFKGPQGDTIVEKGKYTEILKRMPEGKWISVYGMWSSDEPPPGH